MLSLGMDCALGGVDRESQSRVHVRIGHAHFRGDGDFAAEFREHGGALLVLRALAMHDILDFAVTGHRARSCSVSGYKWSGYLASAGVGCNQSSRFRPDGNPLSPLFFRKAGSSKRRDVATV